ncbi:hypothetical protein C8F01DRAFT_1376839 [Mycena amicta]|nr:hypothetical protein C8F01DRAFT_1376839 [Mycena amicta]
MACITCRRRHIKCIPANKYNERRSCVNCSRRKIVCEYRDAAPSPIPPPAQTIFCDFQPTPRDPRSRRRNVADSRTSSSSSPPPVRLGLTRGFRVEPYHLQRAHHVHASPKLGLFTEHPVGDPSPFCLPFPSDSASIIPGISRTNSSFDSSCFSEASAASMYTYLGLHGYVRVPQPRKTLSSPSLLGWDSDVSLLYATYSDSVRLDGIPTHSDSIA